MLKSYGVGGGWVVVVAWSNLESAQGPLVLGLGLKGLGLRVWGQGLTMTQGYQLDHSLSQRLLKHFIDNVLLEHVGLIHVLPLAVHLLC